MFPSADYVLAGELADRRERIANDFARVGRVRQRSRRRHHPLTHLAGAMHASARRLRSHTAVTG